MNKRPFDVWSFDFPDKGTHPVVLVSHPDRCARGSVINVLFCTSQRQNRPPHPFEVMLNGADGLDWETFCDCGILYSVRASDLRAKRGEVSRPRRVQIRAKIKALFQLDSQD
jgi:mRNA-degrading endonuclease toxin of MazEF toxin-antitoxin module